ncbi:uncharacterized protein LOC114576361 [Exaiptasia diaphana]|uniref:RING-type domain-containing protein n=1 Tax=Exaiptasia diaphana TaxID=2652724 RepID=A0A913YX82_EXADI|nr:uncharacterized protein LOC114576361 [Exaiptasia diaphana]
MVSEEVGVRVMLLDSKGLRIMPSEATKGHAFWQPTRKVYAIPVESAGSLEGKRKRSSDQQTSSSEFKEVISELKKMKEDLSKVKDAQEGTESAAQRGTHVTSFLKNVFRCTICFGSTKLPAACCSSCEAIIGCIHCVEQWRDDNQATSEFMCPLCRAEGEYKTVPVIRELQEALVSIDANDLQENGQ